MTEQINQLTIRLHKKDAAMFYFVLESNENVCFYSTLDESDHPDNRDILVNCHISMQRHLDNIIQHFSKKYEIKVLE